MSQKILVAYASVSGSTGEVARAIGEVLVEVGAEVRVAPVREITSLAGYHAVVLGSSIRAGRWLPEAFQFLEQHLEALSQLPVAYFLTCLTMVHDTEDSRRTVLAYMEPVRQKAPQIEPVGLGLFAGSLDPKRQLLPMIQAGLAPQGDYRNWKVIRQWARAVGPVLLARAERPYEPVILRDAVLAHTDMAGVDLHRADLHRADLHEANLSQADLHKADLEQADLVEADLHKADLQEAGLRLADLNWADMSGANLSRANLIGADLSRANLAGANLSGAILNGANLSQANLGKADLSYADLNWANLSEADLSYANLGEANLGWANLSQANLEQTDLVGARYNNMTEWPEDFSAEAHGCVLFNME